MKKLPAAFGTLKIQHAALKTILVFAMLLVITGCNNEGGSSRIDIYLVQWDTLTRHGLSVSDVRKYANVKSVYTNNTRRILSVLFSEPLRFCPLPGDTDVRLVVDLINQHGQTVTYYATFFRLYSQDGKMNRDIDEKFRHQFTTFATK